MEPQNNKPTGFQVRIGHFLLAEVFKLDGFFKGETVGFLGRVKETCLISQRLPLNFTKYALNFSLFNFSTYSFNLNFLMSQCVLNS